MDLKIAYLNVRGLGNFAKRTEVFNWLRTKEVLIYMLQEVDCSVDNSGLWTSEWGYQVSQAHLFQNISCPRS